MKHTYEELKSNSTQNRLLANQYTSSQYQHAMLEIEEDGTTSGERGRKITLIPFCRTTDLYKHVTAKNSFGWFGMNERRRG